jgi:(2Fe-2S) ferredoxin
VTAPAPVFRCADAARERHDPLSGSAPPADQWLLLEHAGPWRVDAVAGSGIDPSVLQRLTEDTAATAARILLIRRPGRTVPSRPRRWLVVGRDRATESGPWGTDRDLLDACDALRSPLPPVTDREPVILVCTHGVHDVCCAIRGRPVAAAIAAQWPDELWECSHVGGDRFAPNVVLLPDGFYYGGLDPETAVAAVRGHLGGSVPGEYLRGMARYQPPIQAAVAVAYRRLGPLGPTDIIVRSYRRLPREAGRGTQTVVELEVRDLPQTVRIQLQAVRRPSAQLTCRAIRNSPATEYRVEAFDVLPPTG